MFRHHDWRPGDAEVKEKESSSTIGIGNPFASYSWEGSKEKLQSLQRRARERTSTMMVRIRNVSDSVTIAVKTHPRLAHLFPGATAVHPTQDPVEILSPGAVDGFIDDSDGSPGARNKDKSDRSNNDEYEPDDNDDIYAEDEKDIELPPPEPGSLAYYIEKAQTVCPLLIDLLVFSWMTPMQLRSCCRPATRFCDNGTVIATRQLPGQTQADYERLCKLEIDDDVINQLYKVFCRMDRRRSGGVTIDDFFDHFSFEDHPFSRRIFSVLDKDASGEIDFKEFVLSVWNLCSLNRNGLALFCFMLFDEDNSGFLEPEEVEGLVTAAYGVKQGHQERCLKIMRCLDPDGDNTVNRADFLKYNNVNPLLLYPAYQFQAQMQVRILGKKWWHSIADQRTERFRANNIFEIFDLFNTEPEFKKFKLYEDFSRPIRKENIEEHPLRKLESHNSAGHHPHPEHNRHREWTKNTKNAWG